jgi:Zn-dependent alcohol dehydrogenase
MKGRQQPIISIRAAVLRTPGRPLKIERLEMEGPSDDEVLVRLVASGICHTDIDSVKAAVPARSCWGTKAPAWWNEPARR